MDALIYRKYLSLLATLLLLLVAYPLLRESLSGRVLLDSLLTLLFLAALLVAFARRSRLPAMLLGIPTIVGLWTGYALPELPRFAVGIAFHSLGSAFLAFCVVVILRDIYSEPGISLDDIYGALCGYLLLGLVFGHLYCVIEGVNPGSFQSEGKPLPMSGGDRGHFLLSYFSLITLTTLGYGDIVPVRSVARGLAVAEAIVGQFYLAVLIGELVGKRVAQAVTEQQAANLGESHDRTE